MATEYKIHKFDFGNEVQYFIPYASNEIKYRGIVFGKVGFDNEQPFISFVGEYRRKYVDSTPAVGVVTAGELVDFLESKINETKNGRCGDEREEG